ncbi:MAG: ribonucleoside-diphosphate reductase subunit alpha [Candidatus Cloacimonadota bacterium]|nr:MAG: ribonucleoside-diphosphate reductase subunit alpha [Candidatus Cloacimonadota bacterium]
MAIRVVKRDGTVVPIDVYKIKKVISFACEHTDCDPLELEMDAHVQFRNDITTEEIQKMVIQTAVEKISLEEPEWQFVAARLLLYDVYKKVCLYRDIQKKPYTDFYTFIVSATKQGLYSDTILERYTKKEIEELSTYIKPERDLLFTFVGIKTLSDRYLIRNGNKEILELPQESFMGIAMFLASKEKDKLNWVKKFYDVISKFEVIPATPTLSNSRKPLSQLSSCFVGTVDDSLDSIFDFISTFAQLSKYGGGVGADLSRIRAQGSEIRGFKNVAGGVVPWIRILNDTAVAVDQLGIRKGALSLTLNVYHSDIFDFLNLKTNNGDDRRKAHDIFPAVGMPDNFMRAVKERAEYYLFDPYIVRKYLGFEISDYYGEEFEKRYDQVVLDDRIAKIKVTAMSIMKMILKSTFETGLPFIFYRDTANKCNPNKHCGVVRSTNLCVEIIQNMSAPQFKGTESTGDYDFSIKKKAGDLVVCNLSSLNLMKVNSDEDIERVVPIQVRMLDNVIDLNFYPVKEAELTNKKYRAIAVGTMSYHALLATKGISWESQEHLDYVDKLYEKISYTTIEASTKLSVEKGKYSMFEGSDWQKGDFFGGRDLGNNQDWDGLKEKVAKDGLRNGYLLAIAPTGSISLIAGATAGIDPIFSKIERTEKVNGVIISAVPELNDATYWLYKEAHKIDQNWIVKAAAKRQKWIDQSQSLNFFVTSEAKAKDLLSYYMNAWESGCKTVYYMRSKAVEFEECESCT